MLFSGDTELVPYSNSHVPPPLRGLRSSTSTALVSFTSSPSRSWPPARWRSVLNDASDPIARCPFERGDDLEVVGLVWFQPCHFRGHRFGRRLPDPGISGSIPRLTPATRRGAVLELAAGDGRLPCGLTVPASLAVRFRDLERRFGLDFGSAGAERRSGPRKDREQRRAAPAHPCPSLGPRPCIPLRLNSSLTKTSSLNPLLARIEAHPGHAAAGNRACQPRRSPRARP